MNLKDLDIKRKYRSDTCPDIGKSFISNVLVGSVIYKRAVGFFSSSALINASYGISYLINKPNSHIYLVVSPYLSKEDIEAIIKGYDKREMIIANAMLRGLTNPTEEFGKERLNFLCHLIENNKLDIKIAYKMCGNSMGMFHEKIGVFVDEDRNKVAFTGSLNESENAFNNNFESIYVFKSWVDNEDTLSIDDDFDRLWNDQTSTLRVCDFPKVVKDALFEYKKPSFHENIDEYEKSQRILSLIIPKRPEYNFPYPLHQYQRDAINAWANNKYRGIFDMATGTGKTVTAYTASVKLLQRMEYHLAVIVVCPHTHLVDQWVEDQHFFNINFIVGYSNKKYNNYILELMQAVQDFNDGINTYFYFITTNASYRTNRVQMVLSKIDGPVLFVGDEVHNLGAYGLARLLNPKFQFRLGLSATVDRHRDEEGTKDIYDYFGKSVFHYGLKEAITNEFLTRYYYYIVPICMTEDEKEKYLELSGKIAKSYFSSKGKMKLSKSGEMYALQRARIIAGADNKIPTLKNVISKFKTTKNNLVYCGTGKIGSKDNKEEERQIDIVCKMLGNDLKMRVARYTSRENPEERHIITERFKNGDDLQALVAIKCLDEGVNIPCIERAFILASSTNPREYVQRRGRVLRKNFGKRYSYIYDFVTLPFLPDNAIEYEEGYIKKFKGLAINEITRIKEFSSLAENEHESDILINKITNAFKLNELETIKVENIEWSDNEND